jgi:NAD(P)-dependent dehydrogenase (short-subunit alcohol dehydrogenase family)
MAAEPSGALTGRVCAVTGGAQGIGWAVTEALAHTGARVYSCDISAEYLASAKERYAALKGEHWIRTERCDVSDSADLDRWLTGVRDDAGRLDILVNNAAFVRWKDIGQLTLAESEQTMRTGYEAMVRAIHLVLPMMLDAGGGHIVNIGSSAGRVITRAASAPYAAAKAAVEAFSETMRLQLRGSPVHVTLVRPGVVSGTGFFTEHVPSSRLPRIADFMPVVTADDVAAAVLEGIRRRRATVDVPGSLPLLYTAYALAPGVVRRLIDLGGSARHEFGAKRPIVHGRS